jgi:hypothetical protein
MTTETWEMRIARAIAISQDIMFRDDVKVSRVLDAAASFGEWVRDHGERFGGDESTAFVAFVLAIYVLGALDNENNQLELKEKVK